MNFRLGVFVITLTYHSPPARGLVCRNNGALPKLSPEKDNKNNNNCNNTTNRKLMARMSWGQGVRWLWAAAVAWGLYGLLLYGHARDVLGSCAFNPAPYRAHLFELDAQRTERAHAYLSQLVAEAKAKTDAAGPSTQHSACSSCMRVRSLCLTASVMRRVCVCVGRDGERAVHGDLDCGQAGSAVPAAVDGIDPQRAQRDAEDNQPTPRRQHRHALISSPCTLVRPLRTHH
jgi:hypothetical protein